MSKEKDINNGFRVGDVVKHSKSDIHGYIHEFEWSGIRRAAIKVENEKAFYIISVEDLILVNRPEKEETHEEGNKKGNSKKD